MHPSAGPWMKIKPAAEYAGIGERLLRTWLQNGLRHSRVRGGAVLTSRLWIDEFVSAFEVTEHPATRLDRTVDEAIRGL